MKIYYNNRRINGRFDSFKAKAKRFFLGVIVTTAALGVLFIAFTTGALTYSTSRVEAVMTTVVADSPVLNRIADCESGNGTPGSAIHFKNGQVLLKANTNGTVDIGKYQVNLTYWGKKATELGLDLTKEADNKKMAEWIYLNKGTTDWSASQKCWYHN
jgi:hypothetical protein